MEIPVFLRIDRVNLQPHVTEILPCQPACPANILKAALATAFPGQQQDFLHAAAGNHLHLMLHLLTGQLHTLNIVVAVKAAVNAVILAVIGQIQRREHVDSIAKMTAGQAPCLLCHFLQKRSRRR